MSENKIKCVVWDLDDTIWNGVLAESNEVSLKPEALKVIEELDNRGILQSISSKNDYDIAMKKLKQLNIDHYFLYPQINWNAKSDSIEEITTFLNISVDTFAFVDDQLFEREEVKFVHKEILCIDAEQIPIMLDMSQLIPKYRTIDSRKRRLLYQNDIKRNRLEEKFVGPKEEFLETLKMVFTIYKAKEEDLIRVEELTVRTHQLNSTGTIYSFEELKQMIYSEQYEVIVAKLNDKYGTYGSIGICILEKENQNWHVRLILMSCRVISKGVGTVMINFIMKEARKNHKKLFADFIQNNRNRIMYITYKLNGFQEISNDSNRIVFQASLDEDKLYPDYIMVKEECRL